MTSEEVAEAIEKARNTWLLTTPPVLMSKIRAQVDAVNAMHRQWLKEHREESWTRKKA